MSTFFKVLGWIFVFITIVGGGQIIAKEGIGSDGANLLAVATYILLSVLCFWGSSRLKNKNNK